ncbi:DUF2069 domain-containing protein [Neisseria meningitidis]|uniref:DUF2069 domain-containing protein n=1 Tax=Neisseria TaxID=482 RepID=UPI000F4DEE94|nr:MULTISPECIES: DUF2069 domain-containing protein [Neisseria]MBH5705871.1 DUF2069 domain-containing protein [Neisseria meningitidis]MBW3869571.1 DUF2069 domain-containing protein [Neisseria meningitidis]MCL5851289.1 DUF2069 domain-containing protein [Neisseria meningitidis]RPC00400.1 hypothetical protein JY22_05540 [Neisseria meningitidis]RPC07325.1 hypothetical protein JY23_03065 [Neisseria meningitidis]
MNKQTAYFLASFSLIALIILSLSWELWIAPLRPGGSWLALKTLPLCLPLSGILKKKIYTYQYSSMLILIYFAEAVMRLFDAYPAEQICAALSAVFSIIFFISCLSFVKQYKETNNAR